MSLTSVTPPTRILPRNPTTGDVNLSIWETYRPGYVHPDFAPYAVHPSVSRPCPSGELVRPELIRKAKFYDFIRVSPEGPCPPGFVKGTVRPENENLSSAEKQLWCTPEAHLRQQRRVHEPVFYTNKAFGVQQQFLNTSNGIPSSQTPEDLSSSFAMRSINPFTGEYSNYFQSKPNVSTKTYASLPSPHSMIHLQTPKAIQTSKASQSSQSSSFTSTPDSVPKTAATRPSK
jgi:hypothetical protein